MEGGRNTRIATWNYNVGDDMVMKNNKEKGLEVNIQDIHCQQGNI